MKLRIIYIKSIFLMSLIWLSACQNDFDNNFDKSPSERQKEIFENCQSTLVNASNGWVMGYFFSPDSGGVNFLTSYDVSEMVNMAGKTRYNQYVYQEAKTRYKMTTENGTSMQFSTYNSILHPYCDPDPSRGKAKVGDFEFVIVSISNDQIILRGKKTDLDIWLNKIPTGISWQDYYNGLDAINTLLFNGTPPALVYESANANYIFSNGKTHVFTMLKEGDNVINAQKLPLINTSTGIRLYKPVEIEGVSMQIMDVNATKDALVSRDNANVMLKPEAITKYINETQSKYWAKKENLSGDFLTLFTKMEGEFSTRYSGARNLTAIGFAKKGTSFCFILKAGANEAIYTIPMEINSKTDITITTFDANNMPATNMDTNAKLFYTAIPSIKEMLTLIQGSFGLVAHDPFTANAVKYTKKDGSGYLDVSR